MMFSFPGRFFTDQKFVPYFKEIDELDESVKSLEAVVQQLDDYTRLMGNIDFHLSPCKWFIFF